AGSSALSLHDALPISHLDKLLPASLEGFCNEARRGEVPRSPVFEALAAWIEADDACMEWERQRAVALLHQLRALARQRLATLKRSEEHTSELQSRFDL